MISTIIHKQIIIIQRHKILNMIPGPARILTCPYCKGEKEVFSFLSANTFGAKQWSDGKKEYPMFLEVSFIQKCPHCGKFYYLTGQEEKYGKYESFELGTLTFDESRHAYVQFVLEREYYKIISIFGPRFKMLTENHPVLLQTIIYAYNNEHGRIGVEDNNKDDYLFFTKRLEEMVLLSPKELDPFLRAEYYRELGNFETCLTLLDYIQPIDDYQKSFISQVRRKALNQDKNVFLIGPVDGNYSEYDDDLP